jgi:hypothetical protein
MSKRQAFRLSSHAEMFRTSEIAIQTPVAFKPEAEREIDYLTNYRSGHVQWKNPSLRSIGPWDFNELDHADRRELRGAGLLAAWIGWYDVRYDSARLKIARAS